VRERKKRRRKFLFFFFRFHNDLEATGAALATLVGFCALQKPAGLFSSAINPAERRRFEGAQATTSSYPIRRVSSPYFVCAIGRPLVASPSFTGLAGSRPGHSRGFSGC
jgi:hypothetical protein